MKRNSKKSFFIVYMISLCMLILTCAGCADMRENTIKDIGKEQNTENQQAAETTQAGENAQIAGNAQTDGNVQEAGNTQTAGNAQTAEIAQAAEAEQAAGNTANGGTLEDLPNDGIREIEFADMEPVIVYASTTVNVRRLPSTKAEVYRVASPGDIFEKTGEAEGWSRVETEGEICYIKSEYLREKGAPVENGTHLIAIDAGHQQKGNSEKEPVGPGAQEMKAKVAGGTKGTATGLYEYELTLMVSEKLRDELAARGYQVYMVRETHDVDISNAERAKLAYDSGAEIFIRIHANGAEDSSISGAMTICPTPRNPYIPELYSDSRRLSDCVLDALTASAGCKKQRVWETDTMSGINWSRIPVTIVEMGYMTNPEEDANMAAEEYQNRMAAGIADGVDCYYADF